jgi:hypothetical protein
MYTTKDLCRWYKSQYRDIRTMLIEEGVIPKTDKGKGKRKRYSYSQLIPIFRRCGLPNEVKAQTSLFNS